MARYGRDFDRGWGRGRRRGGGRYGLDYAYGAHTASADYVPDLGDVGAGREGLAPPVLGSGGGYGGDYARGRGGYGADYGRGRPGRRSGSPVFQGIREENAGLVADFLRDEAGRGAGYGRGGRVRAAEIMTGDPETVTPETTVADAAKKMADLDVGIIPVVEGPESRRLRGVITDRDIAVRAVARGKDGKMKVSDCMTAEVATVNRNDSVQDVMDVMRREQVRRVPVTDRDGRLVGIIAQADLAVEYAGLDRMREVEVEETIERISEPARPHRGRGGSRSRRR